MTESNMNASNSLSELESKIEQCCCNFAEAKAMADLRMRLEEQTVEHYVPGFNSPFVTRQSVVNICEDDPKSCTNCKWNLCYPTYKWCGADLEDPIRSCIRSGRKYWRKSKLLEIQDSTQDIHTVVENLKGRINQTRYEKFSSEPSDVYIKAMDADKPKKKYTIYDLYDLVFPDDPIKAYFDAERKRIEEKYKPQEEIAEKLEAPEVRRTHPEPIPTATYDDHPILVDIACALAAVIILSMVVLVLCEIFFIIL